MVDPNQRRESDIVTGPSFDEFYRDCRLTISRALVLAIGRLDLGREAADEAFTRALERWDEVQGYDNPAGWVYRVGLNWARTRQRRGTREVARLFREPTYVHALPEPELLAAIERLPWAYRSVVVGRFFLDWSIEQTATALGIPEGTVKTRQHRALDRLRRRLEKR